MQQRMQQGSREDLWQLRVRLQEQRWRGAEDQLQMQAKRQHRRQEREAQVGRRHRPWQARRQVQRSQQVVARQARLRMQRLQQRWVQVHLGRMQLALQVRQLARLWCTEEAPSVTQELLQRRLRGRQVALLPLQLR